MTAFYVTLTAIVLPILVPFIILIFILYKKTKIVKKVVDRRIDVRYNSSHFKATKKFNLN